MTRYEAYIGKGWEALGLAQLLVARTCEDGTTDYAVFFVDLLCLGVKEAFIEADVSEADLREYIDHRMPEDLHERFHPACAKKLIEGALAYAENLGFTPHRDFRKARKILAGIDASICPREFSYGRDGRPCYVRGHKDTEEYVKRICAVLEARCGSKGFYYGDSRTADTLPVRNALIEWLAAEPPGVPRFYELSGLITAMLICPKVLSPLKVLVALWGREDWTERDIEKALKSTDLLFPYWNRLGDLVQDATAPGAPPETRILDIWEEDFDEKEGGLEMAAATSAWATGFCRATELWPGAWDDALSRPDLAPHWEVLGWWANIEQRENRDLMIAHATASPPHTLNRAVIALTRALGRLGPPPA